MTTFNITNNNCISVELLEQLAHGNVPIDRQQQMMDHISHCRDCREIYEAFKQADAEAVDRAEREIGALIDERVSMTKAEKPAGRIIKLVAKYAAAASIVGIGIWGFIKIDSGKYSLHNDSEAYLDVDESWRDATEDIKSEVADASDAPVNRSLKIGAGNSKVDDNTPVLRNLDDESDKIVTRGNNQKSALPSHSSQQIRIDEAKVSQMISEANQLLVSGEYLDAKDILEDAINQDPKNSKALRLLGICNLNLKYYSNAIDCFKKVKPASKAEAEQIANYIKECEEKIMK